MVRATWICLCSLAACGRAPAAALAPRPHPVAPASAPVAAPEPDALAAACERGVDPPGPVLDAYLAAPRADGDLDGRLIACVRRARAAMWRSWERPSPPGATAPFRRPPAPVPADPAAPPADLSRPALHYEYAEYLWYRAEMETDPALATQRWERAARQFSAAARAPDQAPALVADAAYAAVLGWKNALAVDPRLPLEPERPDDDGRREPVPLAPRERALVDAFHDYAALVADAAPSETLMMSFLEARLLWRHRYYAEAVALFGPIVSNHPDAEVAEYAANLLLDSLNRLERFDDMVAWAHRMLDLTPLVRDRPELRGRLELIVVQGERKRAERLERARDYAGCARAYAALYRRRAGAERGDELAYNAGVCWSEAGDASAAVRAFDELVAAYPRSPLASRAMVRAAHLAAAVCHYAEAAERYEVYASRYAGERDAADALSRAIAYRRALGDDRRVIELTALFGRRYRAPRRRDVAAAVFALAPLFADRPAALEAHLRRYIDRHGRAGGAARAVAAHAMLGESLWRRACRREDAGFCTEARDRRLGATARQHFETAVRIAGTAREPAPWADAARLYLADAAHEATGDLDGYAAVGGA